MKLRPHHLMCIQNYIGKGYDETFTACMTEVLGLLEEDPQVELVFGCDTLCGACPHDLGGICDSAGKVDRYDRGVAEACGLTEGERKGWSVLSGMVKRQVFGTERFARICSDCQWYETCRSVREEMVTE